MQRESVFNASPWRAIASLSVPSLISIAQWQGGMDITTFDGAQEIVELYLTGMDFLALPVLTDTAEIMGKKNGIIGFDVLWMQMNAAYERLLKEAPYKIIALGGGAMPMLPLSYTSAEKFRVISPLYGWMRTEI